MGFRDNEERFTIGKCTLDSETNQITCEGKLYKDGKEFQGGVKNAVLTSSGNIKVKDVYGDSEVINRVMNFIEGMKISRK